MMVILALHARRTNMKILRPTLVKLAPITQFLLSQAMPSQIVFVMWAIIWELRLMVQKEYRVVLNVKLVHTKMS